MFDNNITVVGFTTVVVLMIKSCCVMQLRLESISVLTALLIRSSILLTCTYAAVMRAGVHERISY